MWIQVWIIKTISAQISNIFDRNTIQHSQRQMFLMYTCILESRQLRTQTIDLEVPYTTRP